MVGGHEIKQKLMSKEISVPLTAQSFIVPKSSLQFMVPRIINGSKVDLKKKYTFSDEVEAQLASHVK